MKVMFCLFAEDVGLLPDKLFTKLVNRCIFEPENFAPFCGELFEKMKKGGWYGNDRVDYYNGGLFDEAPPLPLVPAKSPSSPKPPRARGRPSSPASSARSSSESLTR